MTGGAFLMSREVFESDLWTDTIKFRIFFYIVGNAVFAEGGVNKAGVQIERGQFLRSLRNLQDDLAYREGRGGAYKKIPFETLRRKVKELENEGRITVKSTDFGSLFTVVNYAKYQGFDHYRTEQMGREWVNDGSGLGTEWVNNNNDNKENNVNKDINNIKSGKPDDIPYKEIVDYLNYRTGKNYTSTAKKTRELIKARYNDGFKLDDFKIVIDKKTSQWLNDPKMDLYLRPPTLFGTKFEGYLNERGKVVAINKANSREERTALNTFGVDVGF